MYLIDITQPRTHHSFIHSTPAFPPSSKESLKKRKSSLKSQQLVRLSGLWELLVLVGAKEEERKPAAMSFPGQLHMALPPYNDHILTITERSCADPYVIWDKGVYYMVGWFPTLPRACVTSGCYECSFLSGISEEEVGALLAREAGFIWAGLG